MARLITRRGLIRGSGGGGAGAAAAGLRPAGREPELPRPRARHRGVAVVPGAAPDRVGRRWRGSSRRRRCRRPSAPTATSSRARRTGCATPRRASPTGGWRSDGLVERAAAPSRSPSSRRCRRGARSPGTTASRAGARSASGRACRSAHLLEAVRLQPEARYVVFHCADDFRRRPPYYESIDLVDAFHPQTILAWGMNDGDLPVGHGAPLRLRVERQLGYKHAKFVMRDRGGGEPRADRQGQGRLLGGPDRLRLVRRHLTSGPRRGGPPCGFHTALKPGELQ